MLELKDVSKTYHQGRNDIAVLNRVSLKVEKKQTLAIMGRSGSGKSTLLSVVAGILKSDSGLVTLAGKNYADLSESELSVLRSRQIGFIFQNFHLVSYLNALENVMLPAKVCNQPHAQESALQLLEQVGLKSRASHLPSELSGGERKRVAIARALIHRPQLVLADEPSGSLDQQTGEEIMDLLFKMVKDSDASLVLVTHDREIAKRCERIVEIKNGQLIHHEI